MITDEDAREFYYRSTGQDSGWYNLTDAERRIWKERAERARRVVRRTLAGGRRKPGG